MRAALLALAALSGCTQISGRADAGLDLAVPDLAVPDLATVDLRPAVPDLALSLVPVPGTCTQSGWCWENPLPQGNRLTALWSVA